MSVPTIAIMAPGHMGHAIGGHLVQQGLRVITNLDGRSADTLARAARAGMEDVGSDAQLVAQADMLLSVLPPGSAVMVSANSGNIYGILAELGARVGQDIPCADKSCFPTEEFDNLWLLIRGSASVIHRSPNAALVL